MTHDELMAKIQSNYEVNKHFRDEPDFKSFRALRAVVELHKPIETRPPWGGDKYLACNVCECGTNDGDYGLDYPCPTIQAIEKELS